MTAWVDREDVVVRMHGVLCGCPLNVGHHLSCDRVEVCMCQECMTVRAWQRQGILSCLSLQVRRGEPADSAA